MSADSAHLITTALRDLYKIMDKAPETLPPIVFLQVRQIQILWWYTE